MRKAHNLIIICLLFLVAGNKFLSFSQDAVREIKKISELRGLTREEAAKRYPIKVQATVLWSWINGNTFFVSDDTGSVFVRCAVNYPQIKPGYFVEVFGTSAPGQLTCSIENAQITQIGIGQFPAPRKVSIERVLTGAEDANWVEVEGTVRRIQYSDSILVIGISDDGKTNLNLYFVSWDTNIVKSQIVNSRIRAQGVCGVITDVNLKPVKVMLNVPYWTNIVFIETNATDLFEFPATPINQVAGTNTDRAIKISAEFIKETNDGGFLARDETGQIKVFPESPFAFTPGDEVDVVGFKEIRNGETVLVDALCSRGVPRRILTTVDQIRKLPPSEAGRGYNVDIIGSITLSDPSANMIFVQDKTGGIFVASRERYYNLQQFEKVRIKGIADQGFRLPYIKNAVIERIGAQEKVKAKRASFFDLIKGIEDSNYVEVEGIVRNVEISGRRPRILVSTTSGGKVFLVIHEYVSLSKLNEYIDCKIIAEGACGLPYKLNGDLITVDIHLQSCTNITVVEKSVLPVEKLNPTPISALLTNREQVLHRIVIEGFIFRDNQNRYWISNNTGKIEVKFNYHEIPLVTNLVRVAGYYSAADKEALIENAILLMRSNPEPPRGSTLKPKEESLFLPLITRTAQIKAMRPEDASRGYPVWMRAVATFCDVEWHSLFLHDGETGIYVNLRTNYFQCDQGDYVEIFGFTGAGDFVPVIREPKITIIGKYPLPVAEKVSLDSLLTGKYDSEFVKVQGIVRKVYIQSGHLYIELSSGGEKTRAIIPGFWNKQAPTNLVDSEVVITGACGSLFNQRRQIIGVQILVQNTNRIEIIKPGVEDPFSLSTQPIANLLRYSPEISMDHRIAVEGVVTYFDPGRLLVIEDKTGGIFIETDATNNISVGDYVAVVGFIKREGYTPKLENGLVKRIKKGDQPLPIKVDATQALSADFEKEVMDGRLVKISGQLIERSEQKDHLVFVLQDGSHVFRALITTNVSRAWFNAFMDGDVIEVAGVCRVDTDRFGTPQAFSILLRSPTDVALISSAPWFDEKKLLTALFGLAGVVLVSSIWVGLLKRKIKKQIEIIEKQNKELEDRVAERTADLEMLNQVLRKNFKELEKVKDEIEKREILYRTLFESSQDAIFVEDYEGTVLDVNPAACALHGMSREELIGKSVYDLVPKDQVEFVKETFKKFISGELKNVEGFSLRKDGFRVPVMLAVSRIEYNGKPALLFHVRDITEIKKTQEELRILNEELEKRVEERTFNLVKTTEKLKQQIEERIKVEQALRESEERFSKAFDLNPIGTMLISLDDERIIAVNDAFCRMVEFEKDEILGKNVNIFSSYFNYAEKEKVIQELKVKGVIINYRTKVLTKSGKQLETLVSGGLLTIGNKNCAMFVIHDITKLAEMEVHLRQSSKMQAVGMLAAGIAHDFNNLLTVIQGHAGLIRMEDGMPPHIHASADEILTVSNKAANLVKKLLTFSKQTKVDFKPLNLNKALEETTSSMLGHLMAEDIRLEFRLDRNLPTIFADRTMIDEIILNISLNARDAMPHGGTITYSTYMVDLKPEDVKENPKARPGKYVVLSISDTGHGMSEDVKARIFEPFFTTKEFGKGSGLGMAIVYGIVEQHNGWIEIESYVGVGTTFRIYFPAAGVEIPEEVAAPKKRIEKPSEVPKKRTIMLVEDEKSLRFLLRHLLERHGFKVIEAGSGEEALKIWNIFKDEVDLLLTDIVMPDGMDGYKLSIELKKTKPNLKVLYSSGYSPLVLNPEYNLVEGVNFVYKPYEPGDLINAINNCLERSE